MVAPKPGQAIGVHDAEDFVCWILPADVVLVPAVRQELVDVVPQQPAVCGETEVQFVCVGGSFPPAASATLGLILTCYPSNRHLLLLRRRHWHDDVVPVERLLLLQQQVVLLLLLLLSQRQWVMVDMDFTFTSIL